MGDKAWYQDKIQRPIAHHLVGDVHGAVLGVAGLRKVCHGCLTPLLTLSGRILSDGNWYEAETCLQCKPRVIRPAAEPIEIRGEFGKSASMRDYDLVCRVVATRTAVICSACPIMIVGHGNADEMARSLDP